MTGCVTWTVLERCVVSAFSQFYYTRIKICSRRTRMMRRRHKYFLFYSKLNRTESPGSEVGKHNHLSTGITATACVQYHNRTNKQYKFTWDDQAKNGYQGKCSGKLKAGGITLTLLPTHYCMHVKPGQ